MIPIYKPYLPKVVLDEVHKAVDSTWVSSIGKYKEKAEEKLKELLGVEYVVLNNSGTASMHLVAHSLKYMHPEVTTLVVPNNVYVAAWNPFLIDLGYKLIPVDADINTWNMDLSTYTNFNKHTALLAVHNLGNIVNIPKIKEKYPNLVIVEDNCEGLFGTHDHTATSTKSLASAISFFGNKTITAGEGGAFITNNEDLYHNAFKLTGQGQTYHTRYLHDRLGFNYRMTNIQAALLYGQLNIIEEILGRKEVIFETYRNSFERLDNIKIQVAEEGTCHSNWMFGVRFPNKDAQKVSDIYKNNGIDTRPMFFPMSAHDHLKTIANLDEEIIAQKLYNEVVILPSYPELSKEEVTHIINITEDICQL